jgi:uracil-DNA glycosylase
LWYDKDKFKGANKMDILDINDKIKNIATTYSAEPTSGFITGDGPIPCDILFVGEAPGKTEVQEGRPFVGVAGKTFEKYLSSIGIKRKDIRITNTCFLRPIKNSESKTGRSTISNRPPKTFEIEMFRFVLDEEVALVSPKIIITLGNVPLKRFTAFTSIGECHGNPYYNEKIKRTIFPMYHPSSLTYNHSEEFLKNYEEDWRKLKKAIDTL